ncbi:hypothetical protein [Gemmata sp.]|uniref:hypothetical protein n=1 Tax=Gemmata sp. TaxID=1914242 RepID=UPI003F6E5CCC
MAEGIEAVIAAIDAVHSIERQVELKRLQELADLYFTHAKASAHLDVWFRLYERFPEDDGFGVFWSFLHGIETHAGYEVLVVESVRRCPSRFPMLMVNRMLNSGIRKVDGVDLLDLLRETAANKKCRPSVREDATDFLHHQQANASKLSGR